MLHTGEAGGHGVGHESDGCCNNNYNNKGIVASEVGEDNCTHRVSHPVLRNADVYWLSEI